MRTSSERKKSLVRKWAMRSSVEMAAVAAGEESSSAFEEIQRTVRSLPSRDNLEGSGRGRRVETSRCVAEGGADVDVFCFQVALERYFYRLELALQIVRMVLVVLTLVFALSLTHYGVIIVRWVLVWSEQFLCGESLAEETPPLGALSNTTSVRDLWHVPPETDRWAFATSTRQRTNGGVGCCAATMGRAVFDVVESSPALAATTLFARPLVQLLLLAAIILVSRIKRFSRLEPIRHAAARMNKEVLEPTMGLRYDIDSNLLLVETTS